MKTWIKLVIILAICIVLVGAVYIWRFGWPEWENKDEKMLQNIVESISQKLVDEESTDTVQLIGRDIVYTRQNEITETITFKFEKGLISSAINEKEMDITFFDETVSKLFETVAEYNGYSADNARYSLTKDILNTKTLEVDGYQYTSLNDVSRFMVATNKKLNLANKEEVYIKESDLQEITDILKNRLQYRLIEKPGIVVEKNISYSRNLVFVVYEQEKLTDRTYTSIMSVLRVLTENEALIQYVKDNYPVITRAGTLTLDGITISLNEGLGEGNVHYYEKPDNYEYMLVKINIDKYVE